MPSEIKKNHFKMALNNQEDTFSSIRQQQQQQQQVKTPYIISKFSNMELNENETLFRQVRILVNKLTPQNMENITNQLISLPILTEDQLIGSIEIIFKNAIDEQSFSQIYAQLCKALSSIKVPSKNDSFRTVNYRTMLLTRCQKEFNTDYYQAINYDQLMKEVDQCKYDTKKRELIELANEKLTKAKRRSLGNIRFIGELFKLSMLTESTMNDCIERLLKQENDEENLECLCRLLTTIGKEVDKPNNATKMKIYFDHLERLVRKKDSGSGGGLLLKSRIRFMILDVLDLRKNQWIPRRKVNNPRPLEEIRKEAEQEALVSAAKNQQDFYDNDSADTKSHSAGFSTSQFKHQQQKSSMNMIKKITDMKQITTITNDTDLLLGPRGNASGFNWTSNTKSKIIDQENNFEFNNNHQHTQLSLQPQPQSLPTPPISQMTKSNIDQLRFNKNFLNEANFTDKQSNLGIESLSCNNSSKQYISNKPDFKHKLKTNKKFSNKPKSNNNNNNNMVRRQMYTDEELEQKVDLFLDEFSQNKNTGEALKEYQEFRPINENQIVIYLELLFNKILERSDQIRILVGFFFFTAINEKLIDLKVFTQALKCIIERIEDISIDVPKITVYLSQVLSQLIQPNFSIKFLDEACRPIENKSICTELLIEIIKNVQNRSDQSEIVDVFKESSLFKIEETFQLIEKQKNMKKLLNDTDKADSCLFEINARKLFKIIDNYSTNETIYKKIQNEFDANRNETQTHTFIRALVTCVCLSCLDVTFKLDSDLFKMRTSLLKNFIRSNDLFQLECLKAFQSIDYKLQHQYNFISSLFDICYDERVISEANFWNWKKDSNLDEGHSNSLLKLAGFYVWLSESM